ncbi:DUF2262 domain-containing protein [Aeoliella sp. ICT_H6.2]|uniref:DUF2262 domain-containing protein n=1 Tax=Aeoliella straminimaris TaxID=2954799 RepID=A0A9X2JHG7_9BACT|nr:DUF2262 domain-containing protein [Aeoliella straminimaris]MCO6045791.1 DUF2262 domain-containing protein [Aeoliella straminimaris]
MGEFTSIAKRQQSGGPKEQVEATWFFGYDGSFAVGPEWLTRLKAKLERKLPITAEVKFNEDATRLSLRLQFKGVATERELERIPDRAMRAVEWFIFWNRKGVKVERPLDAPDYKDRTLGTLFYDDDIDSWCRDADDDEGAAPLQNCTWYLSGLEGKRPPKDRLQAAHALVANFKEIHALCMTAICDELLDVYNNKGWRGDNPEVGRDEFISQLYLSSVRIDDDGERLCYGFEDGLFSDREAEVEIEGGELVHVSLLG